MRVQNLTAFVAVTLAMSVLTGCTGGGGALPTGTFAGSTSTGQPFVVQIGDQLKVNRRPARFIDRTVIEVRQDAGRTTLACRSTDPKGEELRCAVRTQPPQGAPSIEVIDLMLL